MLADENDTGSGRLLAIGKNSYGRCSLHIAVLCQQEEIVDYLANTFPETLKVGDNVSTVFPKNTVATTFFCHSLNVLHCIMLWVLKKWRALVEY